MLRLLPAEDGSMMNVYIATGGVGVAIPVPEWVCWFCQVVFRLPDCPFDSDVYSLDLGRTPLFRN